MAEPEGIDLAGKFSALLDSHLFTPAAYVPGAEAWHVRCTGLGLAKRDHRDHVAELAARIATEERDRAGNSSLRRLGMRYLAERDVAVVERDALVERLAALRLMHDEVIVFDMLRCSECGQPWPCRTARILDAALPTSEPKYATGGVIRLHPCVAEFAATFTPKRWCTFHGFEHEYKNGQWGIPCAVTTEAPAPEPIAEAPACTCACHRSPGLVLSHVAACCQSTEGPVLEPQPSEAVDLLTALEKSFEQARAERAAKRSDARGETDG